MRHLLLALPLAVLLASGCTGSQAAPGAADTKAPQPATGPLGELLEAAKVRASVTPRVPLAESGLPDLAPELRLHGQTVPNFVRALGAMPQAQQPFAELVHAVIWRGSVSAETKAAMGLRIAQINGSPYVAAHMSRVLQATERGRALLSTFTSEAASDPQSAEALALEYGDRLTRNIHGVGERQFAETRAVFNDSEIVELTITTAFFNYFTRFAEAVRLPVESWALEAPAAWAPADMPGRARVGLISDEEMIATARLQENAREQAAQRNGLGLGIANSQRAMMRAPALGWAWRAYGQSTREKEEVPREMKLHVSFAVSMANGCRYCTLHQVLGLRRVGVDPGKLVSMKKDDSALTPRELVAVTFARKLTAEPSKMTDADFDALKAEFGERGALELVLQTCNFAFMNRFTDGLQLPSEDEAVKVYLETYGAHYGD
jgi:AhpD family alkylhydroperoxidase